MSVRIKTLIVIGLTFLALLGVLFFTVRWFLLRDANISEDKSTTRDVTSLLAALDGKYSMLESTVADWAQWDDTYNFILSGDTAYVDANLPDTEFTSLGVELMLFIDNSGKVVYGKMVDLDSGAAIPIPKSLSSEIQVGSPLLSHKDPADNLTGILSLPEGPMIISSQAIVTSQGEGPIRGTLIMGRRLDEKQIAALSQTTQLSISAFPYNAEALPDDVALARNSLVGAKPIFVADLSETIDSGYTLINDVYGNPALILRVDTPRDAYIQANTSVRYLGWALLSIGLALCLVTMFLVERMVILRITRLNASVIKIGREGIASSRVKANGADEIFTLATSVNSMLDSLQDSQEKERESDQRYSNLATISPVGIFRTDPNGANTYVNPMYCEISGLSVNEALGAGWLGAVHPEDKESLTKGWQEAIRLHKASFADYRFLRLDGKVVWVMGQAIPETNSENQITGYVGTITDITGRKLAEEALRATEEKYRSIFENSIDGIFQSTLEGRFLTVNPSFAHMLGYASPQEMVTTVTDIARQVYVDSPRRDEFVRSMTQDGNTKGFEFQMRRKDGSTLWVSENVSTVRDAEGNLLYYEGTVEDITARKQTEEALRASEEKFHDLFNNAEVGMFRTRLDGSEILDMNERFLRIFGYTREEMQGTASALHWADPHERQEMLRLLESRDSVIDFECGMLTKQGDVRRCLTSLRLYRAQGILEGSILDITERKEAQTLREAVYQIAASAENTRSLDDLYPQIHQIISAVMPAENFYITLYDSAHDRLQFPYFKDVADVPFLGAMQPGTGLTAYVLKTGKSLLCDQALHDELERRGDVKLFGAPSAIWLGVPLIVEGITIGAMVVQHYSDPKAYGEREQHMLEFVSRQVALAINRKQAEEQISNQLNRISALRDIDLAISSSLDLHVTLNILLSHVSAELNADATAVLLLNHTTTELDYAAGHGFRTGEVEQNSVRLGEGMVGRVALERRTISTPDLAHSNFLRRGLIMKEGFISHVATPLIAKGEIKGVLEVFQRRSFNPNPDWVSFLETLAGQTAIAIDDAQLFENLQRANSDLTLAYDRTIEGWSHALDLRDKETEGHTLRVAEVVGRLARMAGVAESELIHIRRGALLHDIGKMGVPDGVLLKPGMLTEDEWVLMRQHPKFAFDMLFPIAYLKPALDIPYAHHEWWDGTGYPRKLKGEQIPLAARLFAVVDVWDALLSDRPYRQAWSEQKVIDHILAGSGTHFDPKVVQLFLNMIREDAHNHG